MCLFLAPSETDDVLISYYTCNKQCWLLGVRNNMFLENTVSFCFVVFSDFSTQSLTWKLYVTSYRGCIAISVWFLSFVVCDLLAVGNYYTYHFMNYCICYGGKEFNVFPYNLQFWLNHHHDWPRDRYIVGWDSCFIFFPLISAHVRRLLHAIKYLRTPTKGLYKDWKTRQSSFCTLYVVIETY